MRTFLMGKVGFVEKKVWEPNCWINVVSPTQDDLRYLIDEMGVPEAFIDDVEDVDERSRLEVEDGWTLMILRIPFKSVDTSIPFITVPLGIIVKEDMFVTVCYYETEMIPDFISISLIRPELWSYIRVHSMVTSTPDTAHGTRDMALAKPLPLNFWFSRTAVTIPTKYSPSTEKIVQ